VCGERIDFVADECIGGCRICGRQYNKSGQHVDLQ
jgi:hypothetical protein